MAPFDGDLLPEEELKLIVADRNALNAKLEVTQPKPPSGWLLFLSGAAIGVLTASVAKK